MGNLIVKDNALITASHKLGEVEQRLILLAILKAREYCNSVEQLKGKELIIHAEDYMQTFGVTRQGAYKALKQAVMGLYRAEWGYKYINSKGNKVVAYERFTQSAKYIEAEATVKFRFADAIIPMLVELEKRFTSYEIEQVAELSSSYAMRLYEFFMQHLDKKAGKGWLEISLDDLRFRFGLLPSEYTLMSNFKKFVLDRSTAEINEKTDITVSYTQRKQGRVIVGFRFEFERKTNAKPKKTKEKTTNIDLNNLTDQEHDIIAQKNAYADSIGATAEHRQNLIKQALKQHQDAIQAEQEAKERKKAERQAQKEHEKQQLELARKQYEQILASDTLINAYIANNINPQKMRASLQKMRYEQGDFRGVFELEKNKFEKLSYLKSLNLKFLDKINS
jgi:plasmid replication initiation protein